MRYTNRRILYFNDKCDAMVDDFKRMIGTNYQNE